MSEKRIRVCDGCGKEVKEVRERYHLVLKTGRYWNGIDNANHLEALDFCDLCARDIKATLKKIVSKHKET